MKLGLKGDRWGLLGVGLAPPAHGVGEFGAVFGCHLNCHGTGRCDFTPIMSVQCILG